MESCRIEIKAVPNAPKNEIIGWLGGAQKVKIHAPALEGKANQALTEFLAQKLALPKRSVSLVQGDASRRKLVQIVGLSKDEAMRRLFL